MSNKKTIWGWLGFGVSILIVLLALPFTSVFAENTSTGASIKSDVKTAEDLGVLLGDGKGLTPEYLMKSTTRLQAAIIYLRLKGLGDEARAFKGTDNFADAGQVGASNLPILAYLKAHPNLEWLGSGNNQFEPLEQVTVQQFYKVMLSALGYESGSDFSYADTLSFAKEYGIYTVSNRHRFVNRDIATAVVQTLSLKLKGSSKTLSDMLVAKGALKAKQTEKLANSRINMMTDQKLGDYLTDDHGMTLYYFTKDVANPNACQGGCLAAWPIFSKTNFQVPAGLNVDDFKVFKRTDGKEQVTYKGWPLYYFAGDKKAGDTNGEDVEHAWFVIKSPEYSIAIGTDKDLGNYLTDADGNSLYYFTKDTPNTSNCSGGCLKLWPIFHADTIVVPTGFNAADFGEITGSDGANQTTYKGHPLYYYAGDHKRGDVTGQDVQDSWYVIEPGATFK
ncbi:hypothetical protein PASE110613_04740 [Paenibacillus sediminis]|uniref:Lipoprotein with Yx(FWY)xxD motif n=1 Tax=Paenibacillus sediminis TaxID=664909 RepID=A0ABS4H0N5_9BACL|nr:hypothetical protein [Paenibacillus sediminis]MBP1936079.1 putative lipoprotein with Yx(FWY)xxD motif [Paenibacillus sediminis]